MFAVAVDDGGVVAAAVPVEANAKAMASVAHGDKRASRDYRLG